MSPVFYKKATRQLVILKYMAQVGQPVDAEKIRSASSKKVGVCAVRNSLERLRAAGHVRRIKQRPVNRRGRPGYFYAMTDRGAKRLEYLTRIISEEG